MTSSLSQFFMTNHPNDHICEAVRVSLGQSQSTPSSFQRLDVLSPVVGDVIMAGDGAMNPVGFFLAPFRKQIYVSKYHEENPELPSVYVKGATSCMTRRRVQKLSYV